MIVPWIDLRVQHALLREELLPTLQRLLDRCDFVLGEDVERLEAEFAEYCGARHAVSVDSGLSALELGLRAFGVGAGDEVIVPAHTFIATAAAVTFVGASLVLVDVDSRSYNIDPDQVAAAITPRTRAIIAVHLYGQPAAMDALLEIAGRHNLVVIEDACQAHGALHNGQRVGTLGHAAAFSFYPTKNLGGCGDGGMLVTNDESVADQVRAMRNCGQRVKNVHQLAPFNHRLDSIQAAILRVKLRHLDTWNEARQRHAAQYTERLAGGEVVTPWVASGRNHVYHLYVVRTPRRDELQAFLRDRGVGTAIHYPTPIHLQPFYADAGFRKGQFPIAEQVAADVLSLPMFPELSADQITYVATQVREFSER